MKDINRLHTQALEMIKPIVAEIENKTFYQTAKVLEAFRSAQVCQHHLNGTNGYGYGDIGREALEHVFATLFGAEAALVRPQFVSGTHAIATALFAILRPGDTILFATGKPYDTLEKVIGFKNEPGSLRDWGINYRQIDLSSDDKIDIFTLQKLLEEDKSIRVVAFQRSRGYAWRKSLLQPDLTEAFALTKKIRPDVVIFVDNCYGELVEGFEPTQYGADLVAGSLIKNLGGGLAPTGGYIAGNKDLVNLAAERLTVPGTEGELGATGDFLRSTFHGLYLAPRMVAEALIGAIYAAALFSLAGFEVSPTIEEPRSDIIQAIKLNSAENMKAFCRGIQRFSPIDSHLTPEPWVMPGYDVPVIMAGGTFIAGSTAELSADGPLVPPYIIYFQGGLNRHHIFLAVQNALAEIIARN